MIIATQIFDLFVGLALNLKVLQGIKVDESLTN